MRDKIALDPWVVSIRPLAAPGAPAMGGVRCSEREFWCATCAQRVFESCLAVVFCTWRDHHQIQRAILHLLDLLGRLDRTPGGPGSVTNRAGSAAGKTRGQPRHFMKELNVFHSLSANDKTTVGFSVQFCITYCPWVASNAIMTEKIEIIHLYCSSSKKGVKVPCKSAIT